jgi:MFS transporter, DHA1 family, multidrug resistance protein
MDTGELRLKWVIWRSAAWWPAVLLILVQTLNGMWYMPQLSFFPVYLQELGLPPAAIGGMVAGGQLAGMAVALLGGWVTGLLGSKWVLVCGLALSAVASLAFQIHTLWLVAALWFIGGAGLALITVGGASYLTRVSLRGTLGVLAAIYALSMTVGGAIGTPIAGVIIERRGFSAFGWTETALIVTAALLA